MGTLEAAIAVHMWRGLSPTVDTTRPLELVKEEFKRSNAVRTVRLHHAPGHAIASGEMTEDEEEGDEE